MCPRRQLKCILEVQEDERKFEDITEEITEDTTEDELLKLKLEDLKKKYKRDNREIYDEAIKYHHRMMSDSGK